MDQVSFIVLVGREFFLRQAAEPVDRSVAEFDTELKISKMLRQRPRWR